MTTTATKIAGEAMTDEQIIEMASRFAHSDGWLNGDGAIAFARALLASKPAVPVQDEIADGELIADLIEQNRTLRARLAAPASPSGEDAANVASCELCKGVGQIGMPGQRCFACDGSGKSKFSALAANVAIGEREALNAALDKLGDDKGQGLDPFWKSAFREGWEARAALTAEKVAGQEPYGYAPVHPNGNYFTRNKSTADYVGGLMPVYADPQPAQPVAQTLALTDEQRHSVDFAAALLEVKGYTGRARDLRSILAAQPVSGGKS